MIDRSLGCVRCATALEHGDLRCPVCALPAPVAVAEVAAAPRVLRCTDCGAAVAFSGKLGAPHCGFCGAVMAIEQPVDPLEVAAHHIPFAVDHAAARATVQQWLGARGWFAPKTLRDDAVLESLTPLCWAAWVVNARAAVAWTADSDDGAQRSAWAPHGGQVRLEFSDIVVPASRGLSAKECRRLVPYYDLKSTEPVWGDDPIASPGLAGARSNAERCGESINPMIESFDAQRSAARIAVQEAIEATAMTRVEPFIPGRRFRNVHVACLLEGQTTDRVALPAWVLAYRYRDRPYRAIVHGQRAGVVFGDSPLDRGKLVRIGLAVLAVAAAIAAIILATGCGSGKHIPIDAPDFGESCMPQPATFASLTGRAAVQGTLNVHVDAGELVIVDTTSDLLIAMDLVQTGTDLAVTAEVCSINIPDIPLSGQDMPIQFKVPPATIMSVGSVTGTGVLATADQTCTNVMTSPITLVIGARLDPAALATAPLPSSDASGAFPACAPSATTPCATATGTGCACDQEGDSRPGATLIAHNVPAIALDQVYVTLRTTFSLNGQVWSADLIKGEIDAALDQGILACQLTDGSACTPGDVTTVRTLNPAVTPQPGNPSTFTSIRVPATTTCADIVMNEATLFPM